MDKLLIRGGRRLEGTVTISGAKNAALPELFAALLSAEPVTIRNLPRLHDVRTAFKLLASLGVVIDQTDARPDVVTLHAGKLTSREASYELVKTMRASILVLGPLLARFGEARVSLPGGCEIGLRPVDQHIRGLQAMGAEITVEHGYIVAKAARLKGARITTDMVTVTGTENLLMAAVLADGETILENAAQEPEIPDLAEMLIGMGAKIEGHGTSRIRIEGVERLHGVTHTVIPTASRPAPSCARSLQPAAMFGWNARTRGTSRPRSRSCARPARRSRRATTGSASRATAGRGPSAFAPASTRRSRPTVQAQFMALNCIADGTAVVTETIFENRFMHVGELVRLGAKIEVDGKTAIVQGVDKLSGATVMATDLRASASLVIAGLVAEGDTVVDRIYHLDRGYDQMEAKLRGIGADIERIK